MVPESVTRLCGNAVESFTHYLNVIVLNRKNKETIDNGVYLREMYFPATIHLVFPLVIHFRNDFTFSITVKNVRLLCGSILCFFKWLLYYDQLSQCTYTSYDRLYLRRIIILIFSSLERLWNYFDTALLQGWRVIIGARSSKISNDSWQTCAPYNAAGFLYPGPIKPS